MKLDLEKELNINIDLVERKFINKNFKEQLEKDKILIF
jgi:predicted nucleotidyltransferase